MSVNGHRLFVRGISSRTEDVSCRQGLAGAGWMSPQRAEAPRPNLDPALSLSKATLPNHRVVSLLG
jgi:hypothetical protein